MSSRRKGHDWEREVARDLTVFRGREYATARAVAPDMDAKGVDVLPLVLIPEERSFIVQCKVGKSPRVRKAFRDVSAARRDLLDIPVAAIRWNKGDGMMNDDVAVLSWQDFLLLVRREE